MSPETERQPESHAESQAVKQPPQRLPRGRHSMSRQEVADAQRHRILTALVDVMSVKGYAATSVADILGEAGVSRETFYQQFDSKLDCFMTTFDIAASVLLVTLRHAVGGAGEPRERFARALTVYLDSLAAQPAYSRLFLVEVFAAGPAAFERRIAVQQDIVGVLADLWGSFPASGDVRFTCEILVSAVSSMVTTVMMTGDASALASLHPRIMAFVERALSAV